MNTAVGRLLPKMSPPTNFLTAHYFARGSKVDHGAGQYIALVVVARSGRAVRQDTPPRPLNAGAM